MIMIGSNRLMKNVLGGVESILITKSTHFFLEPTFPILSANLTINVITK